MFPKPSRSPWLLATLCVLPLAFCQPAHAYTLGVGDRADADPHTTAALGAGVYRVVIDPDLPISSYDARIAAHRAVGQEPQLVIGGTGTKNHASAAGVVSTAVQAMRRWPYAYSISVINEPNLSGMSACEYASVYRQTRHALPGRRVMFGEFSPPAALRWSAAIATSCPVFVSHFAWHAYDSDPRWSGAIGNTRSLARDLTRLFHRRPQLYVTEYGVPTRGPNAASEPQALRAWRNALAVGRRYLRELVAWDVSETPASSAWDSSLVQTNGRRRPAFNLIASAAR